MKIIIENCDIANATENVLLNLLGVMKEIAASSEKASTEPVKAETAVEVKTEPKQEAKKQPASKKEEPKQEVKAEQAKTPADPPAPKKEGESADTGDNEKDVQTDTGAEVTPEVSRDDVIKLGKKLVKDGKAKKVNELMTGTYGAHKFSDITDDQLPDVYKAFKELENE